MVAGGASGCSGGEVDTRDGSPTSSADGGRSDGSRPDRDGSTLAPDGGGGTCTATIDTDGDRIPDEIETDADADGDGMPNLDDLDSDGDGARDQDELRSASPCAPASSDGDAVPDFLDLDSDDDGIDDRDETMTDPTRVDTDDDGASDLLESVTGTSPIDPSSRMPASDVVVVLPHEGEHVTQTLGFGTDTQQADVLFLVNSSASMRSTRTSLIDELTTRILPGLAAVIPDLQVGAGGHEDYPVADHGLASLPVTEPGTGRAYTISDRPFYMLRDIAPPDEDRGAWSIAGASAALCPIGASPGANVGAIAGAPNGRPDLLEALEGLPCHNGFDEADSIGQALWSIATGGGLSWEGGSNASFTWPAGSVPARTCTAVDGESGPRRGYPCFRHRSLPIVVAIGDGPSHNGDIFGTAAPYAFPAPTVPEAITALNELGARVVGVTRTSAVGLDYYLVARDTETVRVDRSPIVIDFASDGSGVGDAVVRAVEQVIEDTPHHVGAIVERVGEPRADGFDATTLVRSIDPPEGHADVVPGLAVEFTLDLHNDVRPPGVEPEVLQVRITVLGNRVARLDSRIVHIVIPPAGRRIAT
jgi:hypothetical protein